MTAFTVILRDASGAKLETGPAITHNVERGTYHLLVNSPSPDAGRPFTLTSNFTGTPNVLCSNLAMLGTLQSVAGSLGPGGCTLPNGNTFDGYRITLFGTGTVNVVVNASGFTPLLILRTADGQAVASTTTADDSGAVHLAVPEIGNDTYTLVVAVSSPDQQGGTYTVGAFFTPDDGETCVSQAKLGASQQANGAITGQSCSFNLPDRSDYAPFNFYNIHLDDPGLIQASIDTADFTPLLLLLDADGNPVGEDIESSPTGTPFLRRQVRRGDYRLIVFNEDPFGGAYTLNYQYTFSPAPACPVNSIDSGGQATGILAGSSSCDDGVFLADAYKIVLPADGTVNLSLTSPDFSAFLDLHDAKDNDLTSGTPTADGSGSFLTADLPAGTYYVDAATMDVPGAYSFAYTFTPKTLSPCPAPRVMPPNGFIHNTQLGPASCQANDGRLADFYQFTLPAPATEGIFLTSDSILPELTLYRQDGTLLRTDQNSYVYQNSMLVQYLPAGTFQVRVRSADPTEQGAYNLDLLWTQGSPPQLCAPRTLPASGVALGSTSYMSCAWYDKTFADVYQVTVTDATQVVSIAAQSGTFDAFLILIDSQGNVLASDDNSGGGSNASLMDTLEPGNYYVVIKPAADPTSAGSYQLSVSLAPVPVSSAANSTKKIEY